MVNLDHGDDVVKGQLHVDLYRLGDIWRGRDVVVKRRIVVNQKLKWNILSYIIL